MGTMVKSWIIPHHALYSSSRQPFDYRKQSQFERASNGGTGMSDEKPMTVKERMAALARANSGGQMPYCAVLL